MSILKEFFNVKLTGKEPELKEIGKMLAGIEYEAGLRIDEALDAMCAKKEYRNLTRDDIQSQSVLIQRAILDAKNEHISWVEKTRKLIGGMVE